MSQENLNYFGTRLANHLEDSPEQQEDTPGRSGGSVACPHCDKPIAFTGTIPSEQTITMKIRTSSPLVDAEVVGEAMAGLAKSLKLTAEAAGATVSVFLQSLSTGGGETTVAFVVTKFVD